MIFKPRNYLLVVVTQRLKVVPSSVAYDIAGDYFQALHHIIAPAAPMVRQQSSLIITPE